MTLLVVLCLVIMVGSMLMVLNAQGQLEILRQQNEVFKKELTQLQRAHDQLIKKLYPAANAEKDAKEKQAEAEQNKRQEARDEALETMQKDLESVQKVLEKHQLINGGYPNSVESLAAFASAENMNVSRHNPYTGLHIALFDPTNLIDITHDPADEGLRENAGRLLYQAHLDPQGRGVGYTLAAFDEAGMLLKSGDDVLTLSHA